MAKSADTLGICIALLMSTQRLPRRQEAVIVAPRYPPTQVENYVRNLKKIAATATGATYLIEQNNPSCTAYISSTAASRKVCNDPFCYGIEYTEALTEACTEILPVLKDFELKETKTVVTNILRGGLNFGLREALHKAFGWNAHTSAFLSAQRARSETNADDWFITEDTYKKVYLPEDGIIVMGDVVATGTSLSFALSALGTIAEEQEKSLGGLIFFTIGGPKTEEIVGNFASICKSRFPKFQGAVVVYLEGCFAIANHNTPIQIKLTGTDLLRRDSELAPEFLQSQLENPCFPLERCTIYDAGSRAFHIPEYLEDVADYWEQVAALAAKGTSFDTLLAERLPGLEGNSFGAVSLIELAANQRARAKKGLAPFRK